MGDVNSIKLYNNKYQRGVETPLNLISDRVYNLIIGGCLLWGFFLNALIVATLTEWVLTLNSFVVLIGYIVSCFAGITIYSKSTNAFISFLGYNLIVVPIGVVLTYFLYGVDPGLIFQAIVTTGGVTLIMMIAAGIYPRFFLSIGKTLFITLIAVIIVELLIMLIFKVNPAIFDWAVAIIFCGYIGYDWARANAQERTADNAVDGAASLYVDIINLFIRILSILGRNK